MNLVGKIFVVLIFVMSTVFMAFSCMTYATHRNWRDEALRTSQDPDFGKPGKGLGLKPQLDAAKQEIAQLNDRITKLTADRDVELKDRDDKLAKLETMLAQAVQQRKALQDQADALSTASTASVEQAKVAQKQLQDMLAIETTLQKDIREAKESRDQYFKEMTQTTEQLHAASAEAKRLNERNQQLAAQISRWQIVFQDMQINPEMWKKTPRVEGIVLAASDKGRIEMSLGTDDGVQRGQHFEVYRTSSGPVKYLGRVRVVETRTDKAVAEIIPELKQGSIQKDDRVKAKKD